jgi:hypothetical protein
MHKKIIAVSIVIAVLMAVPAMLAQSGTGNISGRVTDATGAVIPGAKILATNIETGVVKEAATNSAGVYQFQELKPGQYNLQASAPNFKTLLRSGITLQIEDQLGVDMALEVGAVSDTVTVKQDTSGLRTEDAQTGEVVTNALVEEIPNISTGSIRDPFALISIAGNVQGSGSRAGYGIGLNGINSPSTTRINGGRTEATEYLVDGIPVTMGFVHNVSNATPATEDVAEFKVITNGLSAEYGRLSGGALSIATQAGTNSLHGQLFEYNQNALLNANNYQNTAQTPIASKSNFRQNDFGAAMGGPVLFPHYNGRNKTFWFANYEGLRSSQSGNVQLAQTITDQERTGDMRDIGTPEGQASGNDPYPQVWNPYQYNPNQVVDPSTGNLTYEKYLSQDPRCPGQDGECIPQSELNPTTQAYIALLPHPNHAVIAGSGTAGNFSIRQPGTITQNNWSVRIDQNLSEKSNMYARFSYSSGSTYTGPLNPVLGTASYNNIDGGYSATLHYNHAFSPTTLLDVYVGGNYNPFSGGNTLPSSFDNSNLGLSSNVLALIGTKNNIFNVHNGPFSEAMNFGGNLPGGGQLWPMLQAAVYNKIASTSYSYGGSMTKILGRHSLKFGYEGRRYFDNPLTSSQAASNNDGDGLAFTADAVVNQYLDTGSNTWGSQANSSGLGQFLLGVDTWAQITAQVGRSLAQNYYASYVQDDFKATPKLTLNLGLRWEMESPVTERHNNLSLWDPNAAPPFNIVPGYSFSAAVAAAGLNPADVQTPPWIGGYLPGNLVLAGTPEHPARTATGYYPWNFSPRLGFAYQVDPKTVVRGSFAFMYLPTSGNISNFGDAPGVTYSTQASNNPTQIANYSALPGQGLSSVSDLFTPAQITTFEHNTHAANIQTTQTIVGTGGVNIHSRMPRESDWGLSVQRQLPGGWLLELIYSANYSDSLLAEANPSRFPANLHTGGANGSNASIYTTPVAAPFGSQIPCINPNQCGIIGSTMSLGILEYPYPYYGPTLIEDSNIGKSNYESGSVRVEHRYNNGLYLLFNYTHSKSLDDAGGADNNLGGAVGTGTGTGGKAFQTVYTIASSYGLSALDVPNKASLTYIYDLPFGQGRKWMNQTQGVGNAILNGIAGGWSFAGLSQWYSGTPISIAPQGTQSDSVTVYNFYTGLTLLPGYSLSDLFSKNFRGNGSVKVPYGGTPKSGSVGRFNCAAADSYGGTPQSNCWTVTPFTNGNIPSVVGIARNPGNWVTNLSLMKSFPINSDGSRYFQLRLEATNAFNHPGYGNYDNNPQDSTFGYVVNPANAERHLQVGGRFVF